MTLSKQQARRLALHHQGLLRKDNFGRGIKAVAKTIEAIRYVQIDTISVVNRAHHHVLQSRVSNYDPTWLHKLQAEQRLIFEYWHHAAAYMPIEDYRFYLPMMKGFARRDIDRKVAKQVIERITAEGPLQSKDFVAPPGTKSGGWWEWKPTKRALEQLFLSGELMVSERRGFQKVFDLTERVLPAELDTRLPTDSERANFFVDRMLAAQGIARPQDIGYMRQTVSRFEKYKIMPGIHQVLADKVESGEVTRIDLGDHSYFAKTDDIENMPSRIGTKRLWILSPFDNIIINRSKLLDLFSFQYQIECYVPEAKRQYGYFTLPILLGDNFVARIDCKADRKTNTFIINNLWLEAGTALSDQLVDHLSEGIQQFSIEHDCDTIEVLNVENKKLHKALKPHLRPGFNSAMS